MKKSHLLIIGLCLICIGMPAGAISRIDATTRNASASRETVVVARNGFTKLPIVIAANADPQTRACAEELAGYLKKITGAEFTLAPGGAGHGIYVGTITEFPTPSAAAGLRIFDFYDGREAYAIRTEGGSIKLLGATSRGAEYAVSRFLELLGCRFFFQNPVWEVIPKAATLTFNRNETDRPEMLIRYLGYPLTSNYEPDDPDAGGLLQAWWRHNRVGKSLQTSVGHCWPEIIERFSTEFDAHPEYLALVNGKRQGGQLCVSNPAVVPMAIRYVNEYFDKHPDADMIGVGPADGGGYCTCPDCAARWKNPGDQAFYLANEAAKALRQSHPGKFVGIYAYNWHCDPPEFTLEPNVYVELTTALLLNTKYGFDELLELWPKKCRYVGLYDYWAVYDWIRDRLPSGRTGNMQYVAEKLPFYISRGTCGLSAESGNSWGSQGLGYYLGARLLWNSKADVEALKKDFYEKAFGPAAPAMKTYYERIDLGNKPLVGPTFYRLCIDDLERAETAARGQPDILARIEQLKQYHVFIYLLNKTNQPGLDPAGQKTYALEMLTWNYRMRNTYMTFWSFFTDQTTRQLADRFKEESWWWWKMHSQGKRDEIPYCDPAPITAEETTRRLMEIKTSYGDPVEVTDIPFSRQLVVAKWPAAPPEKPWTFASQGGFRLALGSTDGEPVKVNINHGTIYKNFPDGKYMLTDHAGKTVAEGKAPYGNNELELKVPGPGVYYFSYDDASAGASTVPSPETPAAYVLEKGEHFTVYNHSYLYFYVPKGTKELQLYASRGNPFGICQPDGIWIGNDKPIYQHPRSLEGNGAYQSIPVPPGMDGKVWSSVDMVSGSFHFFNIPTIFFVHPDNVMAPREIAEKDGLVK